MANDTRLRVLCDVSTVEPDVPVQVVLDGSAYAVFNIDGRFHVTQDHCTHGPGLLSEGFVMGEEIECPFHQGRFHVPSGQPTGAPCTEPLRVWTALVVDGKICIDPLEARRSGDSPPSHYASPKPGE